MKINTIFHRIHCFAPASLVLAVFSLIQTAISENFDQWRADQKRVKEIAARPEFIGEKEIAFLAAHLYFPESIQALAKVETEAAHAALWKIALAGGNGSQTATYSLIKRMTNKADAVRLCASKSPYVKTIALRGMMGSTGDGHISLDHRAWETVKGLSVSTNLEVRNAAINVVGNDTGSAVAKTEKLDILVEAVNGIESFSNANKTVGYGDLGCLEIEITYHYFLQALMAKQFALSLSDLRAKTLSTSGTVRDCLFIARAYHGDESAKEELRRIARLHESSLIRSGALTVLRIVGTSGDVPVLKDVAEAEKVLVKNWIPHIHRSEADEIPRDHYPLRARALEAIKAIEKRSSKESGAPVEPNRK